MIVIVALVAWVLIIEGGCLLGVSLWGEGR